MRGFLIGDLWIYIVFVLKVCFIFFFFYFIYDELVVLKFFLF